MHDARRTTHPPTPNRQSQEDLTTNLPRGAVGSKSSSAFLPCSLLSERSLLRPLSKREEGQKQV